MGQADLQCPILWLLGQKQRKVQTYAHHKELKSELECSILRTSRALSQKGHAISTSSVCKAVPAKYWLPLLDTNQDASR